MNATNEQLEYAEGACESAAFFGAFLVIVGVVGEVLIAIAHPSYDSIWEIWGSVVADALVAAGVGIEVLFGRIGKARQMELGRRTNEKLKDAIDRAMAAELELARLKAQLAPRSLTKEQFDRIQGLRGQVSVIGMTSASDFEATRYAAEIGLALQYAGIEVKIFDQRIGLVWTNLYVVLPKPSPNLAAEPLYRAFMEAGISVGCGPRSPASLGDIPAELPVIMVGVKGVMRSDVPSFMAGLSTQGAIAKNSESATAPRE